MTGADDLVVVVRTAGERTLDAAVVLLSEQVSADRILVVDERPFEKALRRTYELGIERSAAWTMTLDADVLLRAGAVAAFMAEANRMPADYLQIECRVFDKLTGLYRQAGHRLYRTRLLPEALAHIPAPGATIRPEYSTLQAMGRLGYRSRRVSLVVGLHDFEQYYRDIYRKAFVHARKHQQLLPLMIQRCLSHWDEDRDFRVILKGIYDGITVTTDVSIDTRRFETFLTEGWLDALGFSEKAPISPLELTPSSFADRYTALMSMNVPPRFHTFDEPQPSRSAGRARWDAYVDRLARSGLWRGTAGSVGTILKRIGAQLEAFEVGADV